MSPKIHETLAACGPLLLTIVVGMIFGYSAVLLPQLQEANISNTTNAIRISREEASWVASLAVLPMAIGTLIGGILIQKCGRKMTHMLMCLPYSIGWIVMYFAINLEMILIGRFVTGFCSGVLTPATGVYIGETSEPKYRGMLLGGVALSVSTGLLLVHLLGTFISWQNTSLITSILPLISFCLMLFTPESPSWLAQKGRTTKATESFNWLRGTSEQAKKELEEMLAKHKEATSDKQEERIAGEMLKGEFLKPMGILVIFFITSQWTGVNAVNFYSVTLMKQTLEGMNEYVATFIIDCIRLISSVISCILLIKIGRRPLIIVSGICIVLSLLAISLFIYLTKYLSSESYLHLTFIPLISLVVYITSVTAGFASLPWNLLGELLPLKYRSLGSGTASCIAYLSIFSVVKTMPEMFVTLGVDGTFAIYGVSGLLGTIFVYFCLPETKGKTLDEIEEHFKRNSFKD